MENKVVNIDSYSNKTTGEIPVNFFITEGGFKVEDKYYSKNEIDLKFDSLQAKLDAKMEVINSKIDNLPTVIENQFLKSMETERKERWNQTWTIIGILVGVLGVAIPFIQSILP